MSAQEKGTKRPSSAEMAHSAKSKKKIPVRDRAEPGEEGAVGGADAEASGEDKYTLFYSKASPFSQHHPAEFTVNGVKYSCAEQYMMHQKAVLFGDDEFGAKILASHDPQQQKKYGRQVRNFDPSVWGKRSVEVVKEGNMAKFSQNDDLKKALFDTKGTVLVEASPRDRLWGIGLGVNNPKAHRKANWRGRNLLGYALTQVRDELMKAEQQP